MMHWFTIPPVLGRYYPQRRQSTPKDGVLGTRPDGSTLPCREWIAWGSLSPRQQMSQPLPETFTYDLVDIGREVISQLTIPVAANFTDTLNIDITTPT